MQSTRTSAYPWERATILFLVITTLCRLFQLSTLELVPDEAYYWDWSRHLSLGYYDQGPMIAYVIRLTTLLFGTNEFGVRIGVLAASLGSLVCCYLLAKRLHSPLAGFLTVVLLGLSPLMEVGSLIATYDPLMVFYWTLTLVFLERALFAPSLPQQKRAWLLAGLSTGLGFLSKHTMLLILPCLLLFLFLSPAHRPWLRRPHPYLAFLLTLLLYSGVFWWNSQHHWWTFQHLLFLTAKASGNPLRRFGDYLGSQALLLGPVLFAGIGCRVLGIGCRPPSPPTLGGAGLLPTTQFPQDWGLGGEAEVPPELGVRGRLFLLCHGLPVFLFFGLMSLKAKVQGNWAVCAWLSLTILWAVWLAGRIELGGKAQRGAFWWLGSAGVTSGLLTLLLVAPTLRAQMGIRLPPESDLSNTAYGWRELAGRVQQAREEMGQGGKNPVFLTGNGYQYCALMAFYLPDHPETHDLFLHFRLTMYAAYVEKLKDHLGQDALFINDGQTEDAELRQIFERVEWEAPVTIWRRPLYAMPVRQLYIARCFRFRRYVGLAWAKGG